FPSPLSFHRSAPPRHLPSFPTRRSSDLAILHPADGSVHPARWVRRLAVQAVEAGVEIRERSHVESLDDLEADQVVVERFDVASLDRKSTRLNSSHRTISYAVFCLKKKKT